MWGWDSEGTRGAWRRAITLKVKVLHTALLGGRNVSETRKMLEPFTNYLFRNKKGQLKRQKNNISHTLFWHVVQLRASKQSFANIHKTSSKIPKLIIQYYVKRRKLNISRFVLWFPTVLTVQIAIFSPYFTPSRVRHVCLDNMLTQRNCGARAVLLWQPQPLPSVPGFFLFPLFIYLSFPFSPRLRWKLFFIKIFRHYYQLLFFFQYCFVVISRVWAQVAQAMYLWQLCNVFIGKTEFTISL